MKIWHLVLISLLVCNSLGCALSYDLDLSKSQRTELEELKSLRENGDNISQAQVDAIGCEVYERYASDIATSQNKAALILKISTAVLTGVGAIATSLYALDSDLVGGQKVNLALSLSGTGLGAASAITMIAVGGDQIDGNIMYHKLRAINNTSTSEDLGESCRQVGAEFKNLTPSSKQLEPIWDEIKSKTGKKPKI